MRCFRLYLRRCRKFPPLFFLPYFYCYNGSKKSDFSPFFSPSHRPAPTFPTVTTLATPLPVLALLVATLVSPSTKTELAGLASLPLPTPRTVETLVSSALLPTTVSDPPSADQETAGSLAPLVTSSEGPTLTPTLSEFFLFFSTFDFFSTSVTDTTLPFLVPLQLLLQRLKLTCQLNEPEKVVVVVSSVL